MGRWRHSDSLFILSINNVAQPTFYDTASQAIDTRVKNNMPNINTRELLEEILFEEYDNPLVFDNDERGVCPTCRESFNNGSNVSHQDDEISPPHYYACMACERCGTYWTETNLINFVSNEITEGPSDDWIENNQA